MKTLSEKGFEIDPNSPDYNTAYYEEDVKEFIKEILDEIGELGFQEQNQIYRDALIDVKKIVKQKAGKELIEDG